MSRRNRQANKSVFTKIPQHAVIDNLSHDGLGVARIEGKATFIHGALIGESVDFMYTEKKGQYDKGVCLTVKDPSPLRVKPKCKHYDVCGGCALQHLHIDEQIRVKERELVTHLKHIARIDIKETLPPLRSNSWGYRHKARLSVRYVEKKEKVLVGFRERLSGRLIADIDRCEILHASIGLSIDALKEMIRSMSVYKHIAQIEVAVGEQQSALILRHLEPLTEDDKTLLRVFALKHNVSWYLQPAGPSSVHSLDKDVPLLHYQLPDWSLNFRFKPTDFTQVNPDMNIKMVRQALNLLDLNAEDNVLDLFCGLGNFSLPIATQVNCVVGVEGSQEMVLRASMNAMDNRITNAEFHHADLFKDSLNYDWSNKSYDKILLDPPRAGALALCQQIERFNAKRIVYVSCSPQTLARDAGVLVHEKGYDLMNAGVMDMFPHTSHVESIALFEKRV